jgi:uncharacterized membrane protein
MADEQPHAENAQQGEQHTPNEASNPPAGTDAKHQENTLLAILAYIGPLILVSFLLAKEDPFVKFHIKQGLLLFIGEVAAWMLGMMLWPLFPLVQVANIFLLVLAIVGIIRAAKGEMKGLPLIGHWAQRFTF